MRSRAAKRGRRSSPKRGQSCAAAMPASTTPNQGKSGTKSLLRGSVDESPSQTSAGSVEGRSGSEMPAPRAEKTAAAIVTATGARTKASPSTLATAMLVQDAEEDEAVAEGEPGRDGDRGGARRDDAEAAKKAAPIEAVPRSASTRLTPTMKRKVPAMERAKSRQPRSPSTSAAMKPK